MNTKRNRLISFIICLFVALYFLIGSIFSIINDINIDLSKSKYIVGQVVYSDIREIEGFNFRYSTFTEVFYFKLNSSNQNFAVRRYYEGHYYLPSNIKIGDTLKVYYGSTILDDYNRHVFQIEKGDKILVSYKDYNKNASQKAGVGLFVGIILLIGFIMWFTRFNLLKFLNHLVEAPK